MRANHSAARNDLVRRLRLAQPCRGRRSGTARGPCRLENSAASVPVMKAWQSSSSRIENSAARRPASRCAAISSSSRIGACPTSRRSAAHATGRCRPAAPSARRSSRVRPASPSAGGAPADRSGAGRRACARRRGRARGPSASAGGSAPRHRPPARAPIMRFQRRRKALMSACGNGPSSGSLSIIAASSRTSSARAAAIATPVSAICVSIASNQAPSREPSASSRLRPRIAFS